MCGSEAERQDESGRPHLVWREVGRKRQVHFSGQGGEGKDRVCQEIKANTSSHTPSFSYIMPYTVHVHEQIRWARAS